MGDTEAPLGESHSSCFFFVFNIQTGYLNFFLEKMWLTNKMYRIDTNTPFDYRFVDSLIARK